VNLNAKSRFGNFPTGKTDNNSWAQFVAATNQATKIAVNQSAQKSRISFYFYLF
jgi:hypothetical protein